MAEWGAFPFIGGKNFRRKKLKLFRNFFYFLIVSGVAPAYMCLNAAIFMLKFLFCVKNLTLVVVLGLFKGTVKKY